MVKGILRECQKYSMEKKMFFSTSGTFEFLEKKMKLDYYLIQNLSKRDQIPT